MPKTIFGTTERSNFILNLKTEDYHKYNLRILLLFLVLMPLFSIALEFAKVYSVPGMALSITGVFAIVFMFIGFMKNVTPKRLFVPAGILAAMVIWATVSTVNSYYYTFPTVAIFGSDGRSEGLLSVLFYGCFFLLGAQLGKEKNRIMLLDGMLWMGLAECVWGFLQSFPTGLGYYQNLEPLLLFRVCLPSGLTGSPIFLGTLLVMLEFPALLGAVFGEKKKFYTVCAVVFAVMSIRTQCLIGVCGMVLAVLAALVCLLVKKAGKAALLKCGAALLGCVIGAGWAFAAPVINGTYGRENGEDVKVSAHFALYDGAIQWEDSAYRLGTSGYYIKSGTRNPNGHFDNTDLVASYGYLWKGTAKIIGRFPLTGTGPDCLVYPQLYQNMQIGSNPNAFDRAYNFYLHTAATMGIPMLVLVLALLGIVLVRGGKGAKGSSWVDTGMFGAVVLYLLVMVIGASALTVAPLFWMLAGCCAGRERPAKN